MKFRLILVLLLVFACVEIASGQGCSQCKLVAEQGAQGVNEVDEASFGSNINYGILLLMTVPYILLFALFHKRIFRFFREMRGKKA